MNDEIYFSPSDNGIKIEKYYDQRENQTGLYIEAYKSGLHDGNQQAIEVIKALQERGQLNGNPQIVINTTVKYSLQGTTQGNGLTGGLPPVRFSM